MKKVLLIAIAYVLTACSGSDSSLINTTQQAVRAKLKDPDSAKFGEAFIVPKEEESTKYTNVRSVCGDVAAKNSYGAYDGRIRFMGLYGKPIGGNEMELLELEIEPQPNNKIFEVVHWQVDCIKKPAA
ncbi:hypothetical protein [Comamonas suwonensis]|uniref:Lipoprotein n=1 Tax=Comamonas suwonensis TaxID=2606214 RepID=A0A843BH93_9BURK|nr:hypothetical protein [Comamonas suwonensis]MBI1626969.1 hypothetical protein [Comamonas suwonensis]